MIDLGLKQKETLFQDTESELLSEFYSKSTGQSNKEFRFAKVDSLRNKLRGTVFPDKPDLFLSG